MRFKVSGLPRVLALLRLVQKPGEKTSVYSNRFRTARMAMFMAMVDRIIAAKGSCKIIDLGGRAEHWIAYREHWEGKAIHIVTVNFIPAQIAHAQITHLEHDACSLPQIMNNSFDIVHSNSLIEHVGGWQEKKKLSDEVRRLAKQYYIQTPNYWFPFEPHLRFVGFQWLPRPWQRKLVMSRSQGFYPKAATFEQAHDILSETSLLDYDEMKELFPEAEIRRETILLFTKSFIAVSESA